MTHEVGKIKFSLVLTAKWTNLWSVNKIIVVSLQECDHPFKLAYQGTFGAHGPLGGGMAYLKTPPYGMNGLGLTMGHHSPMDPGVHPSVPYPQGKLDRSS